MKKLLLCLVALFAAIGAQASTKIVSKGEGTSGTSTVKFSATDKPVITAKAVYTLTLNADNTLNVELTFADLNNSDVEGLGNDPCYMFIDGVGNTQLSYADGKYTGTTTETATPGNFYSNCYFMRTCANTSANYGENGQLIFPFEFTAPSAAAESEISGVVSDITATTATLTLTCKPAEGKTVKEIVVSGLGEGKDITFTSTDNLTANLTNLTPGTRYDLTFTLTCTDNSTATSTKSFTTSPATSENISAEISDIRSNSALLTLTKVPEEATSVVVSDGTGIKVNVDLATKKRRITGLLASTKYTRTITAYNSNNDEIGTTTVEFTTLSPGTDTEIDIEFETVNVSDLSALFKLKVDLSDNNQSKEYIHMYLRKANETPEATPDDPYAIYGEEKGTPALDPRSKKEGSNIENPIFFNYTELEKSTAYIATAVVKKEGYTGVTEYPFTTLDHAIGTTSYIENGYFQDGWETTLPDGTSKQLVYLASVRYTFTYDEQRGELYLTFDTRIRNDEKLPELQSKYKLDYKDENGSNVTKWGDPNTVAGYKDHYSFVINNQCPDIATLIGKTPLHFTCYTDYKSSSGSHFNGFDYDGSTLSDDFGEPADVQWIAYSYDDQQKQNKNRYDLYKLKPKTQLMATVVDAAGHYLPRKTVKFEMDTKDEGKAEVTGEEFTDKDGNTQLKWFVEANSLAGTTNTAVDFEVVAYHELETEAAPAGSPRRAVNADKNRLEAKRGFHYVESETATGIDDIEADDANAPVRYFDLNGREISEPQKGMFVIRLQGSKATKMIAE